MQTGTDLIVSEDVINALPPLPERVRYYDDFADCFRELSPHSQGNVWRLKFDGKSSTIEFSRFEPTMQSLLKSWCASMLSRLSASTTGNYFFQLNAIPMERVYQLLHASPQSIRPVWNLVLADGTTHAMTPGIKDFLKFLCLISAGGWKPFWVDLISQLPLPRRDKYASVRIGDVFLTVEEEATIIHAIEETSTSLQRRNRRSPYPLDEIAILICSYQFGMRSKQIAMLQIKDVRIVRDGLDVFPAVHLSFRAIKQRSGKTFPIIRRVKREWSPIFVKLIEQLSTAGEEDGQSRLFHRTPTEITEVIGERTKSLTHRRRTPTELRHTAAQRLVDAGASEEELANFMGHADLGTGLVYFAASPGHAERVNRALGISPIYKQIAKIGHARFVSLRELAELKGEQQIAGLPHGIPISGIGGCSAGQPNCPFNPIMSCYGCGKFMPLAEMHIHEKVLSDMRSIVKLFYQSSRADSFSPAYQQLESNIANIQSVISELQERG